MEPNVENWNVLVHRKDEYGYESSPNNPQCKTSSMGCSKAMKGDICFWHFHRMAKIATFRCGCNQKWKTLVGDSTGRHLGRKYYDEDMATLDTGNNWYCACGNQCESHKCGTMYVCDKCIHKHKKVVRDDDGYYETATWEHTQQYSNALNERIVEGKKYVYGTSSSNGPVFSIPDDLHGVIFVTNSSTCLIAAGRNPKMAEWWIWMAGWYEDCPEGIKSHIKNN
jgi:hypothetical protein